MKRYVLTGLFLGFFGIAGVTHAADGEMTLEDSTSNSGFSVKNSSGSTVARFGGDGKVGIGTSSPGAPLHIAGGNWDTNSSEGDFKIGNDNYRLKMSIALGGAGAGDARIRAQGGTGRIFLGGGSDVTMTIRNGVAIGNSSTFYDAVTSAGDLIVQNNVGIGTTNPNSKLEVSGGNIRVTSGSFIDDGTYLNVPDYVFDADYVLKPLNQVKAYIQKHKHLEGIPDMNDREGWAALSMQDRDMKLLEKIEELTLYVIQLKEENDTLKRRMKAIEKVRLASKDSVVR